jgi:3-mercaptopyruvate sulfurtransferase SseA
MNGRPSWVAPGEHVEPVGVHPAERNDDVSIPHALDEVAEFLRAPDVCLVDLRAVDDEHRCRGDGWPVLGAAAPSSPRDC